MYTIIIISKKCSVTHEYKPVVYRGQWYMKWESMSGGNSFHSLVPHCYMVVKKQGPLEFAPFIEL